MSDELKPIEFSIPKIERTWKDASGRYVDKFEQHKGDDFVHLKTGTLVSVVQVVILEGRFVFLARVARDPKENQSFIITVEELIEFFLKVQ